MSNSVIENYLNQLQLKFSFTNKKTLFVENYNSSFSAFLILTLFKERNVLHILSDEEQALASFNELSSFNSEHTFFFPALYYADGQPHKYYDFNFQQRTALLERLSQNSSQNSIIVSYYDAITEPVLNKQEFSKHHFTLNKHEKISYNFLLEFLSEYHFVKSEFVYFPGQYAVRGNIIDVFSYANEYPIRIELKNDIVDRLSEFHPSTQMSFRQIEKISICPKVEDQNIELVSLLDYLSESDCIIAKDIDLLEDYSDHSDIKRFSKQDILSSLQRFNFIKYGIGTKKGC
ncbi:MAG: hypothetical protein KatS3mg027_2013 [Bacteroidia bacterium]|nr:MAG: hypothetical protein KatS3mg027_2013 [Bacteroidia bacterium]